MNYYPSYRFDLTMSLKILDERSIFWCVDLNPLYWSSYIFKSEEGVMFAFYSADILAPLRLDALSYSFFLLIFFKEAEF